MKCPRCQHENSASVKFCGECGAPLKSSSESGLPGASYAELQRGLGEALEQQTATSEILRVISSSPTDIQPVLDAVAESAARLCESFDSAIFRRDGERLLLVAHHGPIPIAFTLPLVRGTVNGRAVLDGRTVHVADLQTKADEFPVASALTQGEGVHAHLSVPLMREGVAIGTINLRRIEAQLFTERQVGLLQTFADQAVIAIENVRLFKELEARNRDLTDALEQQVATGEILRVISSSPTELQPVLDALVKSAVRFCGADDATIQRLEGDGLPVVAHHGPIAAPIGFVTPAGRATTAGRSLLERRAVHVANFTRPRQRSSRRAAPSPESWASTRSSPSRCCGRACRSA